MEAFHNWPLDHLWEQFGKETTLSFDLRSFIAIPLKLVKVWFCEKVVDLWVELRQRFSQGNHSRIADLQEKLYALKQGNLLVISFFTQLKLWGELENFSPFNPCVCGIQCVWKEYREQDCRMRFLERIVNWLYYSKLERIHWSIDIYTCIENGIRN